jgi:XTP/dITP diphosphohydrolase
MEKVIYFITGNETKILHAQTALAGSGIKIIQKEVVMIEPREEDPEKIVAEKAFQAMKMVNAPLIVEDSGIFIEALGGFPKTFVHFVTDTIGMAGILKLMAGETNRNVEFRQSLAYLEPGMKEPKIFNYVDGGFILADKIWDPIDGVAGEFDRILIPPGEDKPLCMFSRVWRAERDARQNKDSIHYRQLSRWLADR